MAIAIKIFENYYFSGQAYEVHTDTGVCTCKFGQHGVFCKHQALVMKTFQVTMPSSPPILSSDRYELARLALGDKCPPLSFFLGRMESLTDTQEFQHGKFKN
jgi:hypothetical protein